MTIPDSPTDHRVARVEEALRDVFQDMDKSARHRRLVDALDAAPPSEGAHLEYGELGVRALAKILDAAEVGPGERFLDVGSGDGGPVLAAAMLYADTLAISRGIEIAPRRVQRSHRYVDRLRRWLSTHDNPPPCAPVELLQGDVYEAAAELRSESANVAAAVLADSTLAVCFATTWSQGAPRRELPRLELGVVGVLVLVDHQVVERVLPAFLDLGLLVERPRNEADEVVEVDGAERPKPVFVGTVDRCRNRVVLVDDLPLGGLELERDEGVLPQADALRDCGDVEATVLARAVVPVLAHERANDAEHVALVEDREPRRREAESLGVEPQQASAQAVERGQQDLARGLVSDHAGEALPHLARGLVGERDADDAIGWYAQADEVLNAVGDHPRLARAGAREHEQRAVDALDGGALTRVEMAQVHRAMSCTRRGPRASSRSSGADHDGTETVRGRCAVATVRRSVRARAQRWGKNADGSSRSDRQSPSSSGARFSSSITSFRRRKLGVHGGLYWE